MVEDITEIRSAQEELQQSEATLQKLSGRLIEAQEQERNRISRELHDNIGQRLALLSFELRRYYTLCRCGASRNKPFCDGRHSAVKFRDGTE